MFRVVFSGADGPIEARLLLGVGRRDSRFDREILAEGVDDRDVNGFGFIT